MKKRDLNLTEISFTKQLFRLAISQAVKAAFSAPLLFLVLSFISCGNYHRLSEVVREGIDIVMAVYFWYVIIGLLIGPFVVLVPSILVGLCINLLLRWHIQHTMRFLFFWILIGGVLGAGLGWTLIELTIGRMDVNPNQFDCTDISAITAGLLLGGWYSWKSIQFSKLNANAQPP